MTILTRFLENKNNLLLTEAAALVMAGCGIATAMGQNSVSIGYHAAAMAVSMAVAFVPIVLGDNALKSRACKLALAASLGFVMSQAIQCTNPHSHAFFKDKNQNVQPK